MESRKKNGTDEPICRVGIETQRKRMDLWTQWGKERGDKGRKPHQDIYAPGLRGAAGEKLRAAQEPRL